ncbi:Sensory histidine kinase BaeS [Paramagnetospirillum magnetotacticum MS-1]|uniref:histidine kinase n=1 Tax=Paramagnetospirillum magnetotacticum MS-1 TaxID=272627 RepID=A0A0C2YL28_PARME|nr:ATP-binding protein [Paramagnetospirillum magnetotacticum]KIM00490.1 Sensory histidine kinase BaeS [Paramagnetospirillum magnetotacticum MS-1]
MPGAEAFIQLLRRNDLFTVQDEETLKRIIACGSEVLLSDGECLFRKGDMGDSIYVVLDGAIEISVQDGGGEFHVMNVLEVGSLFGEVAILDNLPRTANAAARGGAHLLRITGGDFHQIMIAESGGGDLLMRLLCERVRWINDQVEEKHALDLERRRNEARLQQLMSDTSHELRTPIAVLRAQIEAMQDGIIATDARTLGIVHDQVMGMARLVDDLFTLARSDIGHLDCRFDLINVLDILDGVLEAFRIRFVAADLRIEWPHAPDGGFVVPGDAARLKQVFSNLLENSLRYTDPGGMLRISSRTEGGQVIIEFDDTAPGVPECLLPQLFNRFFRVDVSRSRAHGGSGIGLALCQSLIQPFGGCIDASASPIGGLRITLRLPLRMGS